MLIAGIMLISPGVNAQSIHPGEMPALGMDRITQSQIESGTIDILDLRRAGRTIFTTPFNKLDGYGDGPVDSDDPTLPGFRPTLQDNGTLLRINGLDAQTCLECHSIISNARIPAKFGVGGVGGASSNVIFQPTMIDVSDSACMGYASFNGRFINPPFLFGSGGIELLAKEMTADLHAQRAHARANPGMRVDLVSKGVSFGSIRYSSGGECDTSRVEGIDDDLIVRPFGRKGEFATTREFDLDALPFHFGMQPVEVVGEGVDADCDEVSDEVLVGEVSALSIFLTTMERPVTDPPSPAAVRGSTRFQTIGCAHCHRPFLITESRRLPHSFPEIPTDPYANVYLETDLTDPPTNFAAASSGGVIVPLFADLKRHDMGSRLAESFGSHLDHHFTTARLWGVADTAPYLHDGRAQTLTDAILFHGGEARAARLAFADLSDDEKRDLLAFLRTLRTPPQVGQDLDGNQAQVAGGDQPGDQPTRVVQQSCSAAGTGSSAALAVIVGLLLALTRRPQRLARSRRLLHDRAAR